MGSYLRVTGSDGRRWHLPPDDQSDLRALTGEESAYLTVELVENLCDYDESAGWGGYRPCCRPMPCSWHAGATCTCGAPAVTGCCFSGWLAVCGRPVCGDHRTCGRHAA